MNCFHFSVSLGYKTTLANLQTTDKRLWIAFIFQYLWDTKQLSVERLESRKCCELLSFFSIFGIQNNIQKGILVVLPGCELLSFFSIFGIQNNLGFLIILHLHVVNCFHFSVSLGYKTTNEIYKLQGKRLWIAFIFQYLWDTKQRVAESMQ